MWGDDCAAHHHHQEEHLHEAHQLPAGKLSLSCHTSCHSCQQDGYWNEADCSPDFCQCWRGWGWVKTCMEPLVFDETLPGCRWRDQVESCQSDYTTTTPITTESTTTVTSTTTTTTTTLPPLDCEELCVGQEEFSLVSEECCSRACDQKGVFSMAERR